MRQENRLQGNSAQRKKYKIKTNCNIDKGNIYVDVDKNTELRRVSKIKMWFVKQIWDLEESEEVLHEYK